MKKLEIIIKPEKLEIIKAILDEQDVNGMNFVNTMGYGKQNGTIKSYNGTEYKIGFVPKIKVETIIADEMVEPIVTKILEEVNTGKGLKVHDWMRGYLTYGLPLIVIFIFLFGIYDKFFK